MITVCDNAKETCPIFSDLVRVNEHIGFDDPADAIGTNDEILAVFRRVGDEIKTRFKHYFKLANWREIVDLLHIIQRLWYFYSHRINPICKLNKVYYF